MRAIVSTYYREKESSEMIEVVLSNGDRAEAEEPASALVAAKTLMDEAREAGQSGVLASFYTGGRLTRADVTRTALAAAFPAEETN